MLEKEWRVSYRVFPRLSAWHALYGMLRRDVPSVVLTTCSACHVEHAVLCMPSLLHAVSGMLSYA